MEDNFNKKIFALLLDRARGERSLKKYAEDCDISYVQLRKLSLCEQQNPPRMKLIEKLGANADNDITAEDFAFAAGYGMASYGKRLLNTASHQKFYSLSPRYRKQAEGFINYLLYLSEKEQKSKGNK